MNRRIERLKNEATQAISSLFSDTSADEREQIEAMEEIAQLCTENIEVLREQLRGGEEP